MISPQKRPYHSFRRKVCNDMTKPDNIVTQRSDENQEFLEVYKQMENDRIGQKKNTKPTTLQQNYDPVKANQKYYEEVVLRHFYKPEIKVSYTMKNKSLERKVAEKSKQLRKQMNQQKIQQFLKQNNLNTLMKSYDLNASGGAVPENLNIPDKMKKVIMRINSARTE